MATAAAATDTVSATLRLNERFIDLMEKLSDIMLKQGEHFRARAYQKAQETIMSYPQDILSVVDLQGKPGIGPTIMEKLTEFITTGTLKILEREKNNPINLLADVYGIGPKKASELVSSGITTISLLRANQHLLNDVQKVGLKYYEDVLKRIPRDEIDQFASVFDNIFKKVRSQNSLLEIVGSYRRGATNSGDIDVIITSDKSDVFIGFIDGLIKSGVILEVLSRGPSKCLVMAKIPTSGYVRRVDFLWASLDEFPFAVLYFTGSKIFNTVMRHEALQMGLTMNEHGLYKMIDKKKGEKVAHIFRYEKDIFDYLGLVYKSPQERIDGRAVIKIDKNTEKEKTKIKKQTEIPKKKTLIIENDIDDEEDILIYINSFKKHGISLLNKLSENTLSNILDDANDAYYNKTPLLTDNEYDIIKEYVEKRFPKNLVVNKVGAPVEKNKVTLPYHMGSMNKIKPDTNSVISWNNKYKGPYVLSCKLDGVSGLYTTEGSVPKLYTRGDGIVGQDISHLIPYLRLPKTLKLVIRGEFIIPKTVFDSKYKSKFANPRNFVAGLINLKTINEAIKDIHFVAYEVIKPILKPSSQIAFLSTQNIDFVLNRSINNLTNELLSNVLVEWRQSYAYEIDGIIVTNDAVYERKAGNPEYAFAFKMVLTDQITEAKVVDVIWSASKDGYLKPRVQIEPINLGGVKIEFATGFNAAFIRDNKIGVGAVIELIRSGDVIPHIRKVISPAEQVKMPSVSYKWNDTNIDIILEDLETDSTVKEKVITLFFKGIDVDGLGSGNIIRIIDAGYDTIPKIINMTVSDFLKIDGFKMKMAEKLYNGIQEKLLGASLITIMSASNIFGRGFSEKKLQLILDNYPDVLISKENTSIKLNKISAIKGMADKTAQSFIDGIPAFIQFMKEIGLEDKLKVEKESNKTNNIDSSHPLFSKTIIMSGFRDSGLLEILKNIGVKVGTSVSKNTFAVIVKDLNEDTGKVIDAKKLGIPLMTPEAFKQNFNLC
jgi:NAD-dependent DNA ligase/DNA polymerase/3'-5' exonuclease PolX